VGFEIVGLTGGIGSGKSTVAGFFGDLGVPVVDADQVAREVVEPGTDGLAEVVAEFGEGVLDADGALDRTALGAVVFGDAGARSRLEAILHPRIGALSTQKLMSLAQQGHPYALYEAALLVEKGSHKMMGKLVVVAVDDATQLARVKARDALDDEAALARIASQLPLSEKIAVADHVIRNDGTLEGTRTQVQAVHQELLAALETGT